MQNVFSSKILLKHFLYYVLRIGGNDIKFNSIIDSAIPQKAYNLVRIRKIYINKTEQLKIYVTGNRLCNPHIWKIQLFYMQLIYFLEQPCPDLLSSWLKQWWSSFFIPTILWLTFWYFLTKGRRAFCFTLCWWLDYCTPVI